MERIKELEGRVGAGVNTSGEGHGMVPRETYERLKDEFEEKERGHEKRLQRLKEVSNMCWEYGRSTDPLSRRSLA